MMLSAYNQSYVIFRSAFLGILVLGLAASGPAFAQQPSNTAGQYNAIDPFDPSETVSHVPTDEITLRLRLPAPDLPPSVVMSQKPIAETPPAAAAAVPAPSPSRAKTEEKTASPGILERSLQSIVSVFDWSESDPPKIKKSEEQTMIESSEPIRINIHVGLSKPQTNSEPRETAEAESPWVRTQSRVRRLFTLGETETHD